MTSGTIYAPSWLGEADNQIAFNNYATYPIYRTQQRAPQRRELREFDIDIPEAMGIADWESFIGKVYYVIQGTMYPVNETTWRQGREALQKLSSLTFEQGDANAQFGYVPYYYYTETGDTRTIFMKVMYVDLPESTKQGLKQPFRLFCKIENPVIYGTTVTANIGSGAGTTSGSSNLSFTLPHPLGLTTYSSNGAVNNTGVMAAWPSFTIVGPVTNPTITNVTTGQSFTVNCNLPSNAHSLVINYNQSNRSILLDGNSVMSSLTTGSTLFTIVPGINSLTFTGATVGSGAFATISFSPTYPIS